MPAEQVIESGRGRELNAAKRAAKPRSDSLFDRFVYVMERFGMPTAILCAVMSGIGYGGWWVGNRVLIPISERHIRFIDAIEADRDGDRNILRDISGKLGELTNQQRLTNQILRKNGAVKE